MRDSSSSFHFFIDQKRKWENEELKVITKDARKYNGKLTKINKKKICC